MGGSMQQMWTVLRHAGPKPPRIVLQTGAHRRSSRGRAGPGAQVLRDDGGPGDARQGGDRLQHGHELPLRTAVPPTHAILSQCHGRNCFFFSSTAVDVYSKIATSTKFTQRFCIVLLGRATTRRTHDAPSNKPYIFFKSILSYMHVIYENIHKRVFC